jgi:regulator of protease activity HflC (stomatin/prohibitin superfamily)
MKTLYKITILISLLTVLTSCGFKVVDTGQRGVKVRFGKVTGEPLEEGIYFYNPLTTSIKGLSVREKKYEGTTNCYSKDAQIIEVKYTVNISPQASEIHNIYKEVGRYWENVLIKQVLEGNIKEVTGMYIAVELIEKRQAITEELVTLLKKELSAKRINLISFELNDMDFDNQFEEAVKRKVIAVEQAKEAKNKTVRVKEEATQKIIEAKAEAESMTIRSKALSQNKGLVEYEAVQKWDGKLPQYMMGGATPFINLKGK